MQRLIINWNVILNYKQIEIILFLLRLYIFHVQKHLIVILFAGKCQQYAKTFVAIYEKGIM